MTGKVILEKMVAMDKEAAEVVFYYYVNHAKNIVDGTKEKYILSSEDRLKMANLASNTVDMELRHLYSHCEAVHENMTWFCHYIQQFCLTHREDRFQDFNTHTKNWRVGQHIEFLKNAAKVFYGKWVDGYGGRSWCNCAWYAHIFLCDLEEGHGYASDISWERFLCCCHNNSRWLDKLGYSVTSVLNLGLNATPEKILGYLNDAYPIDSVCTLWRHCGGISDKYVPDWNCRFLEGEDMGRLQKLPMRIPINIFNLSKSLSKLIKSIPKSFPGFKSALIGSKHEQLVEKI